MAEEVKQSETVEQVTEKKSVFETLNAINVNEHTEKKNNLTYLSWAWAWAEVKKNYPLSTYKIYENKDGWNYFTDGKTAWVKTGVTIEGIENIEYLPIMDFRNKSIPVNNITSFDVNKAIQRSLTKAVARHGLGLYIYAGEDLPEAEANEKSYATAPNTTQTAITQQVNNVPVQNNIPEDPSVQPLIKEVLGYITNGVLKDSFADKANYYIQTKDAKGLSAVLSYCKKQSN